METGSGSILNLTPVKLLISIGGIYTCFISFGQISERLFDHDYSGLDRPKGTYDRFNFGFATPLLQNFFSFLIAAGVNRLYYKQSKSTMDLKSELIIGGCHFGSVFLSTQTLVYVSFPWQAIMKSSKILSLLIVSLFVGPRGRYNGSQYIWGAIITAGIIIFNIMENGSKKESATSLSGIALLVGSLVCDGLLGVTESDVKIKFKPNQWDRMESAHKWSGLICLIVSIVTFQMSGFINFLVQYPGVISDLAKLTLLGTFGQIFIFYTMANFSHIVLNIVTMTRKVIIYGHNLNGYQWIGVVLVFLGVVAEMASGMLRKGREGREQAEQQTPAPKKTHKKRSSKHIRSRKNK